MTRLARVCSVSDLSPGEKVAVNIWGESILVVNYTAAFYAVSNICTHEHVELVDGFLMDDSIVCPAHLSQFRLETGEALNPPALLSLKTYGTKVDGGEVVATAALISLVVVRRAEQTDVAKGRPKGISPSGT